jgi:Domain of unknown function (DUF3601)
MYGPEPPGRWTGQIDTGPFKHLVAGRRYEVIREFADHDKDVHPVGESWVFLGHSFVPYHDGLSLFVSLDGVQEWQIRLQWIAEEQAGIINALQHYVQPAPDKQD